MASSTHDLIASLSAQNAPVARVRPKRYGIAILAAMLMYACALIYGFGMAPDIHQHIHQPLFLAELFLLLATLLCALHAAMLAMVPGGVRSAFTKFSAYGGALAVLAVMVVHVLSPMEDEVAPEHSVECALFIALAALPVAALMMACIRKGASVIPAQAGALSVITSVALSALVLRLIESGSDAVHLMLWHYIPSILFACFGAWIGTRVLRW